jgi:hypothetical protein
LKNGSAPTRSAAARNWAKAAKAVSSSDSLAGMLDMNLLSGSGRRRLNFFQLGLSERKSRVQEYCDQRSFRNKLTQEPQALGLQLGREKVYPSRVGAWPIEAGSETERDWIAPSCISLIDQKR